MRNKWLPIFLALLTAGFIIACAGSQESTTPDREVVSAPEPGSCSCSTKTNEPPAIDTCELASGSGSGCNDGFVATCDDLPAPDCGCECVPQ